MEVLEALKLLREVCNNTSTDDCKNLKCEILNCIGDCVFSEVPEEWELPVK